MVKISDGGMFGGFSLPGALAEDAQLGGAHRQGRDGLEPY
jgi:hypothetical protein